MTSVGLWVTGPSRSGTSMTAGLFAAHGVFFGPCTRADRHNAKGYYESSYLKRLQREGVPRGWPAPWFRWLERHGWDPRTPWGTKSGPARWADTIQALEPGVIVVCVRPERDIEASRERVPWMKGKPTSRILTSEARRIEAVLREATVPVFSIQTNHLVNGDWEQVRGPLECLGLELNRSICEEWIDPELWRGRR